MRGYKNVSIVPFHKWKKIKIKARKSALPKVKIKVIQLVSGSFHCNSNLEYSKFNVCVFLTELFFLQRLFQLTHFSSLDRRPFKCNREKSGSTFQAEHWSSTHLQWNKAVIPKASCRSYDIVIFSRTNLINKQIQFQLKWF